MAGSLFEVDVTFIVPDESRSRGFPALDGPGRAREGHGHLVLHGKVFRLTAWWLKVFTPLTLLATAPLFVWFEDAGLVVGLGGTLAIVAADVWQQRVGRDYELRISPGVGYVAERGATTCTITIELDRFVVGGGSRPPLVRMSFPSEHAEAVEAILQTGHTRRPGRRRAPARA